jgi:hypothetical protein
MASTAKKRIIKSLENLSNELLDLLDEQYPNGYEASITRITNAKNEPIFVFPLETADAVYLVKVPATKNSSGGYDVDSEKPGEFEDGGGDNDGDDYGDSDDVGGDEYDGGGEDDDGGSKRGGREASYDPDFDN